MVKISVFDLAGKEVITLVNENLDVGTYNIKWRGFDDKGNTLPSGVYFYEMRSADFISMKKLILVK